MVVWCVVSGVGGVVCVGWVVGGVVLIFSFFL